MGNAIRPYEESWACNMDDRWIQENKEKIEYIFTCIWHEVYARLGPDACTHLGIKSFARYHSLHHKQRTNFHRTR